MKILDIPRKQLSILMPLKSDLLYVIHEGAEEACLFNLFRTLI